MSLTCIQIWFRGWLDIAIGLAQIFSLGRWSPDWSTSWSLGCLIQNDKTVYADPEMNDRGFKGKRWEDTIPPGPPLKRTGEERDEH